TSSSLSVIKYHELEVIIVPVLLLLATLIILAILFILRYCPKQKKTHATTPQRYNSPSRKHTQRHRHNLQGIDGRQTHSSICVCLFLLYPTTGLHLQVYYSAPFCVCLSNSSEKQHFLGFASFVSKLGPHPFLPALLGVVSVQSPLMMVVEELQHRDLLGFLWRCRQDNSGSQSSCDMTESRIFTMAGQVASALEYLHTQSCIHGAVGACNVLIDGNFTAKLWGLGSAYHRKRQEGSVGELHDMEMRKWQAPEVLARRSISQSMTGFTSKTLMYTGDPPFAQLMATDLLQHLQRGKQLKQPNTCSKSLYSIIKACCQWNPEQRLSVSELIRKLQVGEKSANGRTVLKVSEPIDIEKYLREAGYGETYNYAML
uniref:Protein kinase domain-containing protein n=1 Tax=Monopterus albus TaxID=43700 RepID=A0A3Q3IUJ2_MONAL